MSSQIASKFIHIRDTLKLYHWNTRIYARHVASDALVDKLASSIDEIVETIQGIKRNDRIVFKNTKIKVPNDIEVIKILEDFVKWLINCYPKLIPKNGSQPLLNIRDEVLNDIYKTLYLFNFV